MTGEGLMSAHCQKMFYYIKSQAVNFAGINDLIVLRISKT